MARFSRWRELRATLAQLSEDGLLPRFLAWRSRTDAPWVATVLTAAVSIALLLIGDPVSMIAAANFTYLIGIAMPSIAVWLLRRNEPDLMRPYRAPSGTIILGVMAACVWVATTVLGFEQFGLQTVIIGLGFAYVGALFYGWRVWSDQHRAGLRVCLSLHLKLTGAMLSVIGLDGVGYLIAVHHLARSDQVLVTVLEDIFIAVGLLTITVGLVLPGLIAHAAGEVANTAERLGAGTITDLTLAMRALGRGDPDAAKVQADTAPVVVHSHDELGSMAASFNGMQTKLAGAAQALDGAREALRTNGKRLQRTNAQQAAVAHIGQRALAGVGLTELMDDVSRTVADALQVDIAAVFELHADTGVLDVRAAAGIPANALRELDLALSEVSQIAQTLATRAPVVVEDWAEEDRFGQSSTSRELGARSGVTVPIEGNARPYGVLGVQSLGLRSFQPGEIDFLRAVANALADSVDRTRAEDAALHASLHDPLTGLPNRTLFVDRLQVAVAGARRAQKRVAVMFLDLDNFKAINDSRGHDAGDHLLRIVAARLDETLRPGDTLARFGGDEFVIISVDIADAGDAVTVAERLGAALLRSVEVAGRDHVVSASIGICQMTRFKTSST